jgi:hypothetical protein
MADEDSVHQQECDAEANDFGRWAADGPSDGSGVPWVQLLDAARSVLNGHIPAVRIPSPRARDGRAMRRILIDSRDLERLIERWKEVDDTAPTAMHP